MPIRRTKPFAEGVCVRRISEAESDVVLPIGVAASAAKVLDASLSLSEEASRLTAEARGDLFLAPGHAG